MIRLKRNFRKKGVEFTQLFKDYQLVIYQLDRDCYNGTHKTWFEVFRYKTRLPDKFRTDEFEVYPSDECFGTWAWSCTNMDVVQKVLRHNFQDHEFAVRGWPESIFRPEVNNLPTYSI